MKYNEVLACLQNLTKEKPTQQAIADVLGVGQTAIAGRARRNTEFTDDEIKMLEKSFNVIFPSPDGDKIQVDYYPDVLVSCGNGIYSLGESKEQMTVPKKLIKGYSDSYKYVIVTAFSDSMQPEIKEKDMLIVRIAEMENIIDNHIYIFCHEGRFYCKYLSYNLGQVIVRSLNPEYPTRYIEKENLENFELIGEVCGIFRNVN
jgi:phage repressor protein C with HTH and peptisase S24 domain